MIYVSTAAYDLEYRSEFGKIFKIGNDIESVTVPMERSMIKPGFRGMCIFQNEIYVATWCEIYILTMGGKVIKRISEKWMCDLHGIFVEHKGIWVVSRQGLILIDEKGNTKKKHITFDVENDKDIRNNQKPHSGIYDSHINHVMKNKYIYYTVRERGRKDTESGAVYYLKDGKPVLFLDKLHVPHDGVIRDKKFFLAESRRGYVVYDMDSKIVMRKRIENARDYWLRGLAVNKDILYLGASGVNGNKKKAVIFKFNWKLGILLDTIELPETDDYKHIKIFSICM